MREPAELCRLIRSTITRHLEEMEQVETAAGFTPEECEKYHYDDGVLFEVHEIAPKRQKIDARYSIKTGKVIPKR
jgi:hypothetical protein